MPNEPQLLRKELDALRRAYAMKLPEKIRLVEQAWARLESEPGSPESVTALRRLAHSLAGSGATFGFRSVSEAARTLEQSLVALGDNHPVPAGAARQQLSVHLERLSRAAKMPAALTRRAIVPPKELADEQLPEPYRVMIVDGSQSLCDYYARILEDAGSVAVTATDPAKAMETLAEFRPDILLLDLSPPGYSGADFAAKLRQQEAFVAMPIVFLSAESDWVKQMAAMGRGGDDILSEPIDPAYLVAAVTNRAQRARALRPFMALDGLTGLPSSVALMGQLETQLARAKRGGAALAFAMVDIDHFKAVTHTYGQGTGDRVLMSLSGLLKRRLRGSDVIGRHGGEAFAMILNEADGPAAVRVLAQVSHDFGQIRQVAGGEEFKATCSVGIAAYPDCQDAAGLSEAARRALYAAKGAEHGRVMLAE